MKREVVVLTLSEKWGKKCVAVYDVNTGEILRLVSNPQGDGIPSPYTYRLQLLDVIEIEDLGACPLEHQTENILVDLNWGLRKISHIDSFDLLEQLANSYTPIFGDTNYKLLTANGLNHSLEIVKFTAMSFTQNENNRTKASFRVNARWHNYYSVTDSTFFGRTESVAAGYAVVSIPPSDDYTRAGNGYFKYVSAIYPTA